MIRKDYSVNSEQDKIDALEEIFDILYSGESVDANLKPVAGSEVCDFCNDPHPTWSYPTSDFVGSETTEVTPEAKIHHTHYSRGDWAACDVCHGLIEADNIPGLKQRMRDVLLADIPPEVRPPIEGVVFGQLDQFFANRSGPAVPWPSTDLNSGGKAE